MTESQIEEMNQSKIEKSEIYQKYTDVRKHREEQLSDKHLKKLLSPLKKESNQVNNQLLSIYSYKPSFETFRKNELLDSNNELIRHYEKRKTGNLYKTANPLQTRLIFNEEKMNYYPKKVMK